MAALLAEMGPDDAADLLMKLDQERRPRILELVPQAERERLRRLLGYNPNTAGGLMSTEFVALAESTRVEDATAELRRLREVPDTLTVIYTLSGDRLSGAVTLARLLRADPSQPLRDLGNQQPVAVFPGRRHTLGRRRDGRLQPRRPAGGGRGGPNPGGRHLRRPRRGPGPR